VKCINAANNISSKTRKETCVIKKKYKMHLPGAIQEDAGHPELSLLQTSLVPCHLYTISQTALGIQVELDVGDKCCSHVRDGMKTKGMSEARRGRVSVERVARHRFDSGFSTILSPRKK